MTPIRDRYLLHHRMIESRPIQGDEDPALSNFLDPER